MSISPSLELFYKACREKNIGYNIVFDDNWEEGIKLFIRNGLCKNIIYSKFLEAYRNNNFSILKLILEEFPDIGMCYDYGILSRKILLHVRKFGRLDIVDLLLKRGIDINSTVDFDGESALFYACENEHIDVIKYLIKEGINIECENNNGSTCFIYTCYDGKMKILKILIDNGANINHINKWGNNGFMMACYNGKIDTLKILIDNGANINHINERGNNGFMIACRNDFVDVVKLLINKVTNINHVNFDGITALALACQYDRFEIVKLLIIHGVDINDGINEERGDNTGFYYSCLYSHYNIMKLLVAAGVDYNVWFEKNLKGKDVIEKRLKEIKEFENSGEYMRMKIELMLNKSADIYALVVLVSDEYYTF